MSRSGQDWFACPVCGAEVRAGAIACPECGSDDETGWSEDTEYDGVDLGETAFGDAPRPTRQSSGLFASIAIGLIILILLLMLTGVW